jgi:hypothetical protein
MVERNPGCYGVESARLTSDTQSNFRTKRRVLPDAITRTLRQIREPLWHAGSL